MLDFFLYIVILLSVTNLTWSISDTEPTVTLLPSYDDNLIFRFATVSTMRILVKYIFTIKSKKYSDFIGFLCRLDVI